MADAGGSRKQRKRDRLAGIIARISGKHRHARPWKAFKRSQSLEKDLALLSAIGLLHDSARLKDAVLTLVRLKEGNDSDQDHDGGIGAHLSRALQECAAMCIQLAHFAQYDPQGAQQAIDEFHSIISTLQNFNRRGDDAVQLLDQGIRSIDLLAARHALRESGLTEMENPVWKSVLAAGITVLDILKEASGAAGVPVLKGTVGSVLNLFKAAQQTQFNYNDMYSLAYQAGELVLNVAEACSSMDNITQEVERVVSRFEGRLRPIVQRCQELSQKNVFWCFLQNSDHKKELEGLAGEMTAAVQLFQNSNLLRLQARVEHVAEQIDHVAFNQLPQHPDVSALRSEYFPGSREDAVQFMSDWVEKSKDALLWVHGPAGMGKSTLAHHCAQELRKCDRLAASAFITAIPSDNLGLETFLKMLASEIGKLHPSAVSVILIATRTCAGLPLEAHLDQYIHRPLRSLSYPYPLAILIDALDEWKHFRGFIRILRHVDPSVVRFIVTSRRPALDSAVNDLNGARYEVYALPQASEDVLTAYVQHHLDRVHWEDGGKPDGRSAGLIARKADGLFIWVATVFSILENILDSAPPQQRLEQIMHSQRNISSAEGLHKMYKDAILRLFPTPQNQNDFCDFFGLTTVLQEAMPVSEFGPLSGLTPTMIRGIQSLLSALRTRGVFDRDKVQPASALYHLSFIEFVHSAGSSASLAPFSLSQRQCHSLMGQRCVKLTFHDSPTHRVVGSVVQLGGAQRYAYQFWPLHVYNGTGRRPIDWAKTPHSGLLAAAEASGALEQWGRIVSNLLYPNAVLERGGAMRDDGFVLPRLARLVLRWEGRATPFQMHSLEISIRLRPDDLEAWDHLGQCHQALFEHTWDLAHVNAAVEVRSHLYGQCPLSHPSRPGWLEGYTSSLLTRFENIGQASDLETTIILSKRWLSGQECDRRRSGWILYYLATALRARFQRFGNRSDLEEAIQLHREALELRPEPHPDRSSSLNNLANALRTRFDEAGAVSDLEEAIRLHREALELTPAPHPNRGASLNSLALALHAHCSQPSGSVSDIEEAIQLHREALELRPVPHPNRSSSLNNLATALRTRFEQVGIISYLEEAIQLHREALELTRAPHPDRGWSLNHLANALLTRFKQNKTKSDLEEAIYLYRGALELRQTPHPNRGGSLSDLADSLQMRFEQAGAMSDLEETIQLYREALELRPTPHPRRSGSITGLANALLVRYEQAGTMSDLEEVIQLHRDALELRPTPQSGRPFSFTNLANALLTRFEQVGTMSDLEEAIQLHREAVEIFLAGHSYRPSSLRYLAKALRTRFEQTGTSSDLEEAIRLYQEALELTPAPHPDRSSSLTDLANALLVPFQQVGIMSYLEEAIQIYRGTLKLRPAPHPNRGGSLSDLAHAVQMRFEQAGAMSDLEETIQLYRETLELIPTPHPHRGGALSDLARALRIRFEQAGAMSDLEEAIQIYRAALELRPTRHPRRSFSLTNLANALLTRFEQAGTMSDLEEAIQLHQEALELRPAPHPNRASSLYDLASALLSLFRLSSSEIDIGGAVDLLKEAMALRPVPHPRRAQTLHRLADALEARFNLKGEPAEDRDEAVKLRAEIEMLPNKQRP